MNRFRYALRSLCLLAVLGSLAACAFTSPEGAGLCETTPFKRTFDITTTCGGDLSGRFQLGDDFGFVQTEATQENLTRFERVSGDNIVPLRAVTIGACSGPDTLVTVSGVGLELEIPSGASGTRQSGTEPRWSVPYADCKIDLATQLGKDVSCPIVNASGSATTCTIQLTAVE